MASVLSRIQIIMEANTAKYNNEMRQARENSNTTFSKIGKSASKAALVVGTALAGMGALSVKTAMSFETAMAEVNKTADFLTEDGLGNLKKELEDLSKTMPLAFEELADIAASGGQMGIAGENLAQFTETIAKMGIAFDISAGQAAESMGFIASAYQVPIEKLGEVGDAINEVSNNSGATADKTIDFMLRTGAAANNMNIAAEATAAMGAAIIDAGGSVEKSGTAVSGMLLDMANPEWLKDNANLFKEMGVSTTEFARLVKTDGLAAFNMFREGIISTDDPMTALRDSFGAAAPHVQKLFDETSKFVPLLDAVGQGAEGAATHLGSLDNEYRVMADTTENAFILIQNSARLVLAAAGEAFLPAVRQMTDAIMPLVQIVADWAKANPELIQQITLISGALLGTIVGLKLAVDGFTAAKTTIDGLKLGYAALSTTMGLTVLGLGILVAAGLLVYQNWDAIKKVVTENQPAFIALGVSVTALTVALIAANAPLLLLQAQAALAAVQAGIMTVATASWSVAAGVAAAATWTFNAALAVLTSPIVLIAVAIAALVAAGVYLYHNWDEIKAKAIEVWGGIKTYITTKINDIKNYFATSFPAMTAIVSGTLKAIGTVISAGFTLVKNTVTTVLAVVKAIISGDFKAIPGIIGNGMKAAVSIVTNMMGNILNIIKNTGIKLYQVGKDIVMGLINGIKSGASGVVTAIGDMASSAVTKAKNVLNIRSPSRVMKTVGEQTAQGMADGIKKGKKAVVTEAQKMAADAVKAVQDGILNLQKELALFGNNSKVAELDYDVAAGKFKGASQADIKELKRLTEVIELKKELASANDSVQSSIDAMIKKRVLFNNASESASLEYDILYTDKFKNASGERVQQLLDEAKAVEGLAKQLAATNAIKERFAQLEKDREASKKAVAGVMTELVNESPMAKIQADYDRRMEIIKTNEMLETGIIGSAAAERLAIEQSYQDAKRNLMLTQGEALFGDLAGLAKGFAGEQSGIYKALFAVEKGFAIAQSAIAIQQSVAKAMALGFPQNIPVIGQAIAQGASILSSIKGITTGFQKGGYTGNAGESDIAGFVHGREFVSNAESTRRYRPELEAMHNGTYERNSKQQNVNIVIENYSNETVSQTTDSDGKIRLIVGEEIKRQAYNNRSDLNRGMQRNYNMRRNLG